ncbi:MULTISPECIES: polyphosphate kinase 2 family protein [Peptoniphilus]|jgi:polyphosphate:nucleotide phosphotransferase, PPK2 family|uniref:polyphosphate kinase 2 family protein n=1 Tax=Peptoniphilus TaxID=162289 RepID=UPI00028A03D2|nr:MULTISPECIES: polyphosphate kinase 2 family protein [Peptoniphilus]MBS6610511.1 polyphosphate kinase 2 family protein [Peptoniphilus harei]MDU1043012.1 polyphosphate kinase 2 family protein [Peptoniphilus rhinitidis]MDU1954897.1 polyphosphate kinase 2 family protein [Peptoniphilus lacydonensis]MDU2109170.1 polyphosphate kinase 2 family protein [Peptoniphilus lacydonensis]MDU2114732.1 polyphosphate kinase 2 family protein [Peptoniphilus lacydonensis]
MKIEKYLVNEKKKLDLYKVPTSYNGKLEKEEVKEVLIPENIEKIGEYQEKLYAENNRALLIVLQAMDAAGKDSLIKNIMTGVNPQGTKVVSFKKPSENELDHDYLWRINRELPGRGEIGIFNRSHYEDVLVSRVHNLVLDQPFPKNLVTKDIWDKRFDEINNFEEYLSNNGIKIVKFFLHVSKDEQKQRLMERIENPEKNWKFASSDITERKYFDDYMKAYEDMLVKTSTKVAPWYIVPADRKWFSRYLVSEVILEKLKEMDPKFPELSKNELEGLDKWKIILEES